MLQSKSFDKFWEILNLHRVQCLLIGMLIIGIYGNFLWNPVVFDDQYFFDGTFHANYLNNGFGSELRWLPYATMEWTHSLLGLDLIWFHLGNLILHIANALALFFLLQRLFDLVLRKDEHCANLNETATRLSNSWIAFFCVLIFSLHPAAVYAVTYLTQRSTLMATFFTIIMLRLVIEGIDRKKQSYLFASAFAYFFAVTSKEHAVMAPAVAVSLVFLLKKPSKELFKQIGMSFFLYFIIALFTFFQVKSHNVLAQAYQNNGSELLSRLFFMDNGFPVSLAYPLSILTQTFLFFKYLLLWLLPDPAWMSIDMYEDFAMRLWSWPYVLSLLGFIFYFIIAVRFLFRRGLYGLLGFGMLCPWFLFATEFSTVRIQEPFVLYRSYLWMAGGVAIFPYFMLKMPAKRTAAVVVCLLLLMVPLSWNRLQSFSHPYLLWDDAAILVENKTDIPGVERIFYNRGIALFNLKHYPEAIQDYSKALTIYPKYSYAYNNRGAVYLELKQYPKALSDFNIAIALKADYPNSYFGRARVYEYAQNWDGAAADYLKLCSMGIAQGCQKFKELKATLGSLR